MIRRLLNLLGIGDCSPILAPTLSETHDHSRRFYNTMSNAVLSVVYRRGGRHYTRITEAYRLAIFHADPRLGLESAFHLTHNWGNDSARALLTRYRLAYRRVLDRDDAKYNATFRQIYGSKPR